MITEYLYGRHEVMSQHLQGPLFYGVLSDPSRPIRETIFFFHAGNGDDCQFMELKVPAALSEATWKKLRDRGIQIVMPSIGLHFLTGSWEKAFLEEILPRVGTALTQPRHLIGVSMGGRAALSLLFRRPELFAGAAALAPTLIDFDHTDPAQVKAFQERKGVQEPYLQILVSGFQDAFADREAYVRHDPLHLARRGLSAVLREKRISFDVGSADDFGLDEGVCALNKALGEVPHRFRLEPELRHDWTIVDRNIDAALNYLLA